jgi:mRNA interferase MazF
MVGFSDKQWVFNKFSNLAIVCPVTNVNKEHPFHVKLDERTKTRGVILSDQARTLDLKARSHKFIEKIPNDLLLEVIDMINGFIEVLEGDRDNSGGENRRGNRAKKTN